MKHRVDTHQNYCKSKSIRRHGIAKFELVGEFQRHNYGRSCSIYTKLLHIKGECELAIEIPEGVEKEGFVSWVHFLKF